MAARQSIAVDSGYRHMLRAVGAFLDAEGLRSVSLVEGPHGITVRHASEHGASLGAMDLDHIDLDALVASVPSAQRHRVARSVSEDTSRYQDLFRAVGYELDELEASNVLIHELDDALMVTYESHERGLASPSKKGWALLGHDEQRALLESARARRRPQPAGSGLFGLRLW